MSIPFDKRDKNSRCAFFYFFSPWGCLPASFFFLTQSLPSLCNRCHPFEAVECILVDGSHHSHTDKRGKRRLLVRNTCAWARQLVVPGLDWLDATSLFPPRVHFALVLPQLERDSHAPKPTIPQSERIVSSVRNPGTGLENPLRERAAECQSLVCVAACASRPKRIVCK